MARRTPPPAPALHAFTHARELRMLDGLLQGPEAVGHTAAVRLRGKPWLLVATDRRVLLLRRGAFVEHVRGWAYGDVGAIDVEVEGPDRATVTLRAEHDGSRKARARATEVVLADVDKREAEALAAAVQRVAPQRSYRVVRPVLDPKDATHPDDLLPPAQRRLVQLERRRRKGSITAAEYEASRARLLAAAGLPADLPAPMLPPEAPAAPPPWPGSKSDPVARRWSRDQPLPRAEPASRAEPTAARARGASAVAVPAFDGFGRDGEADDATGDDDGDAPRAASPMPAARSSQASRSAGSGRGRAAAAPMADAGSGPDAATERALARAKAQADALATRAAALAKRSGSRGQR